MSDTQDQSGSAVTASEAIAFGTALVTCLSALPVAAGKPELVDLYVMIIRFSLSGLISAFLWYVPLVIRLRIAATTLWGKSLRWGLSAISVVGTFTLILVFIRIVTNGIELIGPIAERYGTVIYP